MHFSKENKSIMSTAADDIFKLEDDFTQKIGTKTSYVQVRRKGGKPVYLRDNQAFIRPRHPKRVEMAPTTTTSVTFGGSEVQTEFRIYEQGDMEEIRHLTLRGDITCALPGTNLTEANFLVEPSPLWINRIEVLVNGSTQLIQTIYGDQLWTNLAMMPTEDLRTLIGGNLCYMGSDFKVNNAISATSTVTYNWHDIRAGGALVTNSGRIAAATTRPFVIPLYGLLTEKFRLRALKGDTIFRIYWNPLIAGTQTVANEATQPTAAQIAAANPAAAPSARFSIANLQMILESEEVLESDKATFDKLSLSSCLYVKFLEPIVQPFNMALTANTETPLQLTAIYGPIAFLQFYVRDVARPLSALKALAPLRFNIGNSTASGLGTNGDSEGQDQSSVGLVTFTDASNKSLYSPSGFKPWDLRYGQYSKSMENELCNTEAIYTLPFCESPQAAILKGAVDGFVKFEANEYLRIRPSDGWVSGTYRIVVVAWKVKHIEIDKRTARVI